MLIKEYVYFRLNEIFVMVCTKRLSLREICHFTIRVRFSVILAGSKITRKHSAGHDIRKKIAYAEKCKTIATL